MGKRYEHEDDQPSDVKEESYTLDGFSNDCGQLAKNYVIDGFKEKISLLIYNEKEEKSCHQSKYVKEPIVCNNQGITKKEMRTLNGMFL